VIYKNKMFAGQNPKLEDGDVLENCNLMQNLPNTTFDGQGAENVTVIRGNCVNCAFPASWDVQSRMHIQVSYCAHLHPDMGLPEEQEDCPHVVSIDEIVVDGAVTDTIYTREDTIL